MRCWWCGIEGRWVDTGTLGSVFSTRAPGPWPAPGVDHDHAHAAPTPEQLERAGYDTLMRIRSAALDAA